MPSRVKRRDDVEDEERYEDEEPRRRSRRDRDEEDERPARRSRSSRDEDPEDEEPRERRRRSRSADDDDEERPSRAGRRTRGDRDKDGGSHRAAKGFDSYRQKRAKTGDRAAEFKPEDNTPTLFKLLDDEPFDNYVQHWVNDAPKGDPKSYMCYDDEYHKDFERGCPLCEVGESGRAFSLWNVLDLTNPNKPEVKVWATSPVLTDTLERMSRNDRTSPLAREDLYFEIEKVVKKKKTEWRLDVVKARDLDEDFKIEPFSADELADFEEKRYDDRKDVTRVDSWDRLDELAEYLTS